MSEKNSKNYQPDEDHDALVEKRIRMRFDWQNLIEDLIEDGRQRGAFDDLPGKGKPLNLNRSPYGREHELAHDILKHNDLKPAWIAARQSIREQHTALRENIRRTWARHETAHQFAPDEGHRAALRISWDDACRQWETEIKKLNKAIVDFNLRRPSDNLELFKTTLERELARVDAPRWLK